MIMTVNELRQYLESDETDTVLTGRLSAIELMIQRYCHNDFSRVVDDQGEYPMDIKMGVVSLMRWEVERRDKIGVASETISRHSVTYVDQTGANTAMGYPAALMGFLQPYKRARFGQRGANP